MKLHYYAETDSLYLEFQDRPSAETREVMPGFLVDLDEEGRLVGLDIDHASQTLDLKAIEAYGLPEPQIVAKRA